MCLSGEAISAGGQRAGRHLIGQRLEQVKVASIDQRDVHRKPGEVQGRLDPAEPAADDDDMGAISDTGLHECQETVYAAGLNC